MEDNIHENTDIIEDISQNDLETLDDNTNLEEAAKVKPSDIDGTDDDSKEDDGEGLDDLGDEDSDVDNDGDSDESDEYLKNRRKKVTAEIQKEKTMKKEDTDLEEDQLNEAKYEVAYIQQLPGNRKNSTSKEFSNLAGAEKFAKANYSWVKPILSDDEINKILRKAEDDMVKSKSDEQDYKMTISGVPVTVSVYRHKLSAADKRANPNVNADNGLSKNYMYGLTFDKTYQGIHDPNVTKAAENAKKLGLKYNTTSRMYEEVDQFTEDITVDCTDIKTLVESEEGLTEEFKDKATIIFEAAVLQKAKTIREEIQAEYETRLVEETESIKSTLEEQVDNYLTYAAENWIAENAVAIESTLRTEIAENFIQSLKNVFVEHYVEVPESKIDVVAEMETSIAGLQEEANRFERISEQLAERVEELSREKVIAEVTSGLADTQIEKIKSLVEDVEYSDESTFAKKVNTIKEFYIAKYDNLLTEDEEINHSYSSTETIIEGDDIQENISPEMQKYLGAISRLAKATTSNL